MTEKTAADMLYEASVEFLREWDNHQPGWMDAIDDIREAVAAAREAGIGAP